jgi:hypothetical protein
MDNVLASDDGIIYEIVKYLYYDEHNDEDICMNATGEVKSYRYIKKIED